MCDCKKFLELSRISDKVIDLEHMSENLVVGVSFTCSNNVTVDKNNILLCM